MKECGVDIFAGAIVCNRKGGVYCAGLDNQRIMQSDTLKDTIKKLSVSDLESVSRGLPSGCIIRDQVAKLAKEELARR